MTSALGQAQDPRVVLFLDIDRSKHTSLLHLEILIREIQKTKPVGIVISTKARIHYNLQQENNAVVQWFSSYIIDQIPLDTTKYKSQAERIQAWLSSNPKVIDFLVIDNSDKSLSTFGYRCIQTKSPELMRIEVLQALKINLDLPTKRVSHTIEMVSLPHTKKELSPIEEQLKKISSVSQRALARQLAPFIVRDVLSRGKHHTLAFLKELMDISAKNKDRA